ncbi:hypothetical protein FLJC2902T_05580 [Flavobacterium limnosediminis JC2902]|uniref:Neuromedin U n=1 Tax=Flavobacterium limnosediminis JC2902 TaxID=1341181 RepID=V6T077_9FLAO|nr:hypothetical protein [Flavobacterium limnosediminis]ESU30065.1 hypothetical protein FLJC2902T_05580 [Flavobacterium limnosediminis JC2902]
MKKNSLLFLLLGLWCSTESFSQVKEEEKSSGAALATNPLAYVTKLQFQPNFTFLDNGGKQFAIFNRIIRPSKSLGLPFIKSKNPDKFYTIYRLEAPIISKTVTDQASNFNATGTDDFILLDAIALKRNWGIAGVGGGVLIPLGSPNTLSFGKWCAGPTGVVIYNKVPKLQLVMLVQQFFSFAGNSDRPDQNFMYFQPQVTKLFPNGYFIQTFPIMKFDWENDKFTIPVNLMFGKAFAKDRSMFLGPQYVVNGPAGIKDSWAIMFNINTMFQ